MSNKKIINLETTYTPWTLDTYQTFTFDNAEDMILEDLDKTAEDVSFSWDHKGYLKDLSINLIDLLKYNILDDVILSIEPDGDPASPAYYNYISDHLFINWTVNINKLKKYINDNIEDYNKNKIGSGSGFCWLGDEEETMLNYYLFNESVKKYSDEAYFYDQLDGVLAWEYVTYKINK